MDIVLFVSSFSVSGDWRSSTYRGHHRQRWRNRQLMVWLHVHWTNRVLPSSTHYYLTAWRAICSACCGKSLSSYGCYWHYPGRGSLSPQISCPLAAELCSTPRRSRLACVCSAATTTVTNASWGSRQNQRVLCLDADAWDGATALQRPKTVARGARTKIKWRCHEHLHKLRFARGQ